MTFTEDQLERYRAICERCNDCGVCPLRYPSPQEPACQYIEALRKQEVGA